MIAARLKNLGFKFIRFWYWKNCAGITIYARSEEDHL